MVRSDDPAQSDARRLTDSLRAGSLHSRPYARNGSVDEQASTLNIILDGGVLRQRVLSNGRVQTVAVYFRDDVINLGIYASGRPSGKDYLLALEGRSSVRCRITPWPPFSRRQRANATALAHSWPGRSALRMNA